MGMDRLATSVLLVLPDHSSTFAFDAVDHHCLAWKFMGPKFLWCLQVYIRWLSFCRILSVKLMPASHLTITTNHKKAQLIQICWAQPIRKAQQIYVQSYWSPRGWISCLRFRPSVTRWGPTNKNGPIGPGPLLCPRLYRSQSKWAQSWAQKNTGPIFCSHYIGANQNGPNMETVKTIHFCN